MLEIVEKHGPMLVLWCQGAQLGSLILVSQVYATCVHSCSLLNDAQVPTQPVEQKCEEYNTYEPYSYQSHTADMSE
jgi:hypothetical protein